MAYVTMEDEDICKRRISVTIKRRNVSFRRRRASIKRRSQSIAKGVRAMSRYSCVCVRPPPEEYDIVRL